MIRIGFNIPFRKIYGSSEFSPSQLPGIARYGSFSGLVTNTDNIYGTVNGSGGVTSYKDLSGNGNHATEATNFPDLTSDGIQFTSANSDRLNIISPTFITSSAGEVMFAFKDTAGPGAALFLGVASNSGSTDFIAFGFGSDDKLTIAGLVGNTLRTDAITRSLNSYHLVSFSTNGVDSTQIFYDGLETPITTGTVNHYWLDDETHNQFSFCAALDTTPNYYNGAVIADIITTQQLSTANRNLAFNWLNLQL